MERPLNTDTRTTTELHDPPVPVRAKLAAAWTSFMFLYIYVDYFALYKPGVIDDILAGVVWEFDISQTLLTAFLTSVAIPILMVMLSDVQRGGRVLDVLLRPGCRTGSDRARRHPALRLDLAPHVLTVDARARRTTPTAAPDGTVGPWLRSEQPV
jgi:hypothetical protein